MARVKSFAGATISIWVAACSTAQPLPTPLPPNSIRASPDYYRLVIDPLLEVPAEKGRCQLRNPENDLWFGWLRDAWLSAQDQNAFVGIAVSYNGQAGPIHHEMPIFQYHAKSFGGACEIETNRENYQTSLFRMDNAAAFSLTALTSTKRQFDTRGFQIATTAAVSLAVWNGVPEILANTLGKAASLTMDSVSSSKTTTASTQQIGLVGGLERHARLSLLSLTTDAGPINIVVDARLSPVASALQPHLNAVPDFSRIPAEYALTWQIAGRALPAAVDLATDGK